MHDNFKKGVIIFSASAAVLAGAILLEKLVFFKPENNLVIKGELTPEQIAYYQDKIDKDLANLKLFPKQYDIYLDLGNVYHALGDNKKAIEHYKIAWEIIPENAIPWLNIGNVQIEMGDYEEAEQSFLKAKEIRKDFFLSYFHLARLYRDFLTEKKDLARSVFLEGLINTNNDYELLYHFYTYLIELEDYSEAAKYLQVFIDKVPDPQNRADAIQELNRIQALIK